VVDVSGDLPLVQGPQAFQKFLGFFELRKQLFFFAEGRGMDKAPAAAQLDGVPQVEHLVVDQVFNGVERDAWGIENAADDDGVVRGIVMAQAAQSLVAAPCHLRSGHQAVEEAEIQIVKNLVEIVMFSQRTFNALASAQLAYELRLLRHGMAAGVFAVTRGVSSVNGLAMQLGDEDVQDGIEHRLGRALQKIREADKDASLAQADGAIDVGEAIETDFKLRQRRARAQITVCLLENLGEVGSHLSRKKQAANLRE